MPPRATTIDETIVATPRRARLARRRAMVRFKNRYLVVEIAHNDGRAMEDARKERDLLDAIRDAVKENFGDVGAGRAVAALSVRYADAMTGVCGVRCDRERARAVRGAVTTMEGFRGRRAAFAVTHCGGTVRGARDACVRRLSARLHALVAEGRVREADVEGILETQGKIVATAVTN